MFATIKSKISSYRTAILYAVIAAVAILVVGSLSGCGKPPPSMSTLEDTRATSRANALFNLQLYRAENPRFSEGDWRIVSHADETISPSCPQGDGWANLSMMKVVGKEVEKYEVVCSTHSSSLGCYLLPLFKQKPFGSEEGHCQPTSKVPFPLVSITK